MPKDIAGAIKEGFALWKTFIATREQAYQRKRDKDQERAIEAAEKYILTSDELKVTEDEKEKKELLRRLERYKSKFLKYN